MRTRTTKTWLKFVSWTAARSGSLYTVTCFSHNVGVTHLVVIILTASSTPCGYIQRKQKCFMKWQTSTGTAHDSRVLRSSGAVPQVSIDAHCQCHGFYNQRKPCPAWPSSVSMPPPACVNTIVILHCSDPSNFSKNRERSRLFSRDWIMIESHSAFDEKTVQLWHYELDCITLGLWWHTFRMYFMSIGGNKDKGVDVSVVLKLRICPFRNDSSQAIHENVHTYIPLFLFTNDTFFPSVLMLLILFI